MSAGASIQLAATSRNEGTVVSVTLDGIDGEYAVVPPWDESSHGEAGGGEWPGEGHAEAEDEGEGEGERGRDPEESSSRIEHVEARVGELAAELA